MIKIGLFGGTFDPFHDGHLSLIQSFTDSGLLDEIWVIPTYSPGHRETGTLSAYQDRLQLCRLALEPFKNVAVSDIEAKLPAPSYSVQTLGAFKKLFPDYSFFWCLGSDQLESFHHWVLYEAILEMSGIVAAERPGFDKEKVRPEVLLSTIFVKHQPIDISATVIREQIRNHQIEKCAVSEAVKRYIIEKRMYQE